VAEVIVELLTKAHDRSSFDCGREDQNRFLKERARRHAELNYSKTWVAVEQGNAKILGYETISMGSVVFDSIDETVRKILPKYPMPVLHVGQLATDRSYAGRGLGSLLLQFAAKQAIIASRTVGCHAMELIADNQEAYDFYVRRGFIPLAPNSRRLYQSIETLKQALDDDLQNEAIGNQ